MGLAETPSSAPFAITPHPSLVMSPKVMALQMGIAWSKFWCPHLIHPHLGPLVLLVTLLCPHCPPPVPPRITAGPSPVVAVTSVAVTLRCDATGSPAPALIWLKDGNPVPEEVAGGPQVRWLPQGGLPGDILLEGRSGSLFWLFQK